jgi:hypothetical protein
MCDYSTHYVIDSPARPPQSRTRHTIILTTLLTPVERGYWPISHLTAVSAKTGHLPHTKKHRSANAILTRHLPFVMKTNGQDKLHTTEENGNTIEFSVAGTYENDRFRIKSLMA